MPPIARKTVRKRKRIAGLAAPAMAMLAAATIAAPAAAQPSQPYYGPHMWEGAGWMFFGPLTMILFIAAIVALVVLLVRWMVGSGGAAHASTSRPLDILKERFARGEINKDEYEERRRVLGV